MVKAVLSQQQYLFLKNYNIFIIIIKWIPWYFFMNWIVIIISNLKYFIFKVCSEEKVSSEDSPC